MIYNREYSQRLLEFRKQLRIKEVHARRAHQRAQMIDSHSLQQVALLLAQDESLSAQGLLVRCRITLLTPFSQEHCSHPPTVGNCPSRLHVSFWQQYLLFLENNPLASQKAISELITFLDEFRRMHCWSAIQACPFYADALAELIEFVLPVVDDCQRKSLALWLSGMKRLRLIVQLIGSRQEFPLPKQWEAFYRLLREGLNSQHQQEQTTAADALVQIIKYASPADISVLYSEEVQIFHRLLALLEINCASASATPFWLPLYYLTQSQIFSLELCRQGIASICGHLLASGIEKNMEGALSILTILSRSQIPAVLQLLLIDKQITGSRMWLKYCFSERIYLHQNPLLRKLFLEIVSNALLHWGDRSLQEFTRQMYPLKEDFINAIVDILEDDGVGDEQLICICLQSLLGLLVCLKGIESEISRRGLSKIVSELGESGCTKRKETCQTLLETWSSLQKGSMISE